MWKEILIGIAAFTIPVVGIAAVALLTDEDDPEV